MALAAAGCTTGSDSGGSGGTDTLTIAVGADIDTFDPQAQVSASVIQRLQQVVESLTTLGADGTLKPLLATEWKAAPDGMSWDFTLRQGVTFSDGTPLNAAAVKFSLDRVNSPETLKARPDALVVIKSTEVVDDTHVRINLKSKYPALPRALSLPVGGILSPDATRKAPNSVQQVVAPVGTGPYAFKENVKGDHLTLTANQSYWGDKPTFATQIWKVVPEATSRLALLKSNGADIILDPPGTDLASLREDDSVELTLVNATNAVQLVMKTQSKQAPQLADPRVRQALSYAINREQIVKVLAYGAAEPLKSPVVPWTFGACDANNYAYDPAKAKQLLAEAGATNLKLRMGAPNGRYLNDYKIGEAVAGDLRAAGVQVDLANPTDFPTYLATVYTPPQEATLDVYIMGLGSVFLDGGHALRNYLKANFPPTGYNGGYYDSPEFDQMVNTLNQEGDETVRAGLICDAQKKLMRDAPAAFLYALQVPVAVSAELTGLIGHPAGMINPSWVKPKS
ncbi:ABC transporter substrate-binding protein [Phytohabitans sp. ZYX-F-186]|uniref:ABC transporter substrate-binding protein n=1 Tax=Phytohabitans maris TaxID=3071409 RepID=A0ABU0ZQ30_9ACTN|nr:ABC transporter substrate-binding protein [Phytohabitans sp. ZYX-F-186]MDQ7908032.1 ABC transporter substrate-binding protein [Phytohabitans sp. ZYX-F-186]